MVDLIFILVILGACWVGARKGVFGAVVGLCGSLVSYVGARILTPTLSPMIAGMLQPRVERMLLEAAGDKLNQAIQAPISALSAELTPLMQALHIPETLFGAVRQNLQLSGQDLLSAAAKTISQEMAPAIAFLIGFVLCKAVIWVVVHLASSRMLLVRAVNHGAGLAVGAVGGLVIVLLLCLGMRAFAPQGVGGFFDQQTIAQSTIGSIVYALFPG